MAINIARAVKLFYAIDALAYYSTTPACEPFRKSHERWLSDLQEYQRDYNAHLAAAIFDYTVAVCLGEARHAGSRSDARIDNFVCGDHGGRTAVFAGACRYDPFSALRACKALFGPDVNWNSGYGGPKWEAIAAAGLYRAQSSDLIFIDHCVDLSHNNNSYFDKGYIFEFLSRNSYTEFLNKKRDATVDISYFLTVGYGLKYHDLLTRGQALGIVPTRTDVKGLHADIKMDNSDIFDKDVSNDVLEYVPIEYGKKTVSAELEHGRGWLHCESCGDRIYRSDAIWADGGYYCTECAFVCDKCGEGFVGESSYYHGQDVCDDCYHDLRREYHHKEERREARAAAERLEDGRNLRPLF